MILRNVVTHFSGVNARLWLIEWTVLKRLTGGGVLECAHPGTWDQQYASSPNTIIPCCLLDRSMTLILESGKRYKSEQLLLGVSCWNLPAHPLPAEEMSRTITFLPGQNTSLLLVVLSQRQTSYLCCCFVRVFVSAWKPVQGKSSQSIKYHGRGKPRTLKRGRKPLPATCEVLSDGL